MDNEKILSFLNLEPGIMPDTFLSKAFPCAHVLWSVLSCFLPCLTGNRAWFDIAIYVFVVVTSLASFLSIRFIKNAVWQWFHYLAVALCSEIVLLYGWLASSEIEELPKFTWMHAAVLCSFVCVIVYALQRLLRVYHLLKTHTVEQVRDKTKPKSSHGWFLIPVVGLAPICARIFKGPFSSMGLGMGFFLWAIQCIWLFFMSLVALRVIIICKHKVYQWYKAPDDVNRKD